MDQVNVTTRVIPRYEETLLGLPYPIEVLDAVEEISDDDGAIIGTVVPDSEGLSAAVALVLCFMPVRLIGAEVRFMRKVMDISSQDLAAAFGIVPETLSRVEHGKHPVSGWMDKAIRMATVLLQSRRFGTGAIAKDVVTLRSAPREPGTRPVILARRMRLNDDPIWEVSLEEITNINTDSCL